MIPTIMETQIGVGIPGHALLTSGTLQNAYVEA
jgi:hypothetical protein